ncbi:MAG: protein kinase [Polyangiales bacterium]
MSSALQPGQTFGRYQIVRTLGVGSFGIVYEAVQYPLGRSVALKLLHDRTLSHPDAQARFEREAMAAARMRHPHIVEVFDFGAHEGTAFLAMELLEGESLQALIRRSGALPQGLAVDLLLPIISAVAAVHDQGIVHRDLKPENILLTVTPEREWHPKLLDFGIAKLEHAGPELTRTNALLGTPCYMSPEQVMQARSIDGRADQWSMGVMLYEAVTGAKPFFSETLLVIMTAITSEDPVPPRVHRPELDPGFEAVVLRALQRRPEDRFASMRDLGSALLPYASEAAQARWYADFNEAPQSAPRMSGANLRAPRFSAPPTPAVPSFAVEEEATKARQDSAPVDEPTELVNTTSQDGEFPAGFLPPPVQPIRAAVTSSQSQPGVKVSQSLMQQMPQGVQPRAVAHTPAPSQRPVANTPPPSQPQDLFAQENAHEVGTGTLAMDLDTAPGRLSPMQGPGAPRPATAKMPSFKATVEMDSPVVPMIAPVGNAPIAPGMPQNPYMPQYGHAYPQQQQPPHYPVHGASPDAYPGGTFNYTSGEVARPAPQKSSRAGLFIGLVALVMGVGALGGVYWFTTQRKADDQNRPAVTPPRPSQVDAAVALPTLPAVADASAVPLVADAGAAPLATDAGAAPLAVDVAVIPAVDAAALNAPVVDAGAPVANVVDAGAVASALDASAPRGPDQRGARERVPGRDAGVRIHVPRGPRGPRPPRGGPAPIF